jgi:hypothetical protein
LNSYREELLRMIGQAISSEWSVDRFREEYYPFFLERVPTDALAEADENFFASVQEKLDWTSESPTDEERQLGWFDYIDFIQWLRTELELYNSPRP